MSRSGCANLGRIRLDPVAGPRGPFPFHCHVLPCPIFEFPTVDLVCLEVRAIHSSCLDPSQSLPRSPWSLSKCLYIFLRYNSLIALRCVSSFSQDVLISPILAFTLWRQVCLQYPLGRSLSDCKPQLVRHHLLSCSTHRPPRPMLESPRPRLKYVSFRIFRILTELYKARLYTHFLSMPYISFPISGVLTLIFQ